MDHFAGLDVSVKETSICIVDDAGKIVREGKVASEPEALLAVLKNPAYHFKRIGLGAGPLSQWLFSALAEAGLPVICVETRHMQAVLKAQINKTDRNDARGIAQMMRINMTFNCSDALDDDDLQLARAVLLAVRRGLKVLGRFVAGDRLLEARELDDDEAVEFLRALEDLELAAARQDLAAELLENAWY